MSTEIQTQPPALTGKAALDAETLRQNLRMILALLFDLRLVGSQACGHLSALNGLPALQLQLDGIVQTACEATETLSERLRVLDAAAKPCSPDAAPTPVLASPPGERSTAAMLDRIANRILTVANIIGSVHDRLDTADASTADVLRAIKDVFQEQALALTTRELATSKEGACQ
ncbi:DNA starvation/stationary phase protection protein [Mycobacterium sp. NPDC048908]|uniref:DNA starvation/stationary phase protection protein n=1 Tax=Mycobacterium sp. NPDC048908 TaxID=3364292 RepID=UPI00371A706D